MTIGEFLRGPYKKLNKQINDAMDKGWNAKKVGDMQTYEIEKAKVRELQDELNMFLNMEIGD